MAKKRSSHKQKDKAMALKTRKAHQMQAVEASMNDLCGCIADRLADKRLGRPKSSRKNSRPIPNRNCTVYFDDGHTLRCTLEQVHEMQSKGAVKFWNGDIQTYEDTPNMCIFEMIIFSDNHHDVAMSLMADYHIKPEESEGKIKFRASGEVGEAIFKSCTLETFEVTVFGDKSAILDAIRAQGVKPTVTGPVIQFRTYNYTADKITAALS